MPLGTLDAKPPPFFRQGQSALSKLLLFSALAVFLMVADLRLEIAKPVRIALASALYPGQWLALRPVLWTRAVLKYFESLTAAQLAEETARHQLALQAQRASQVEQLALENGRLRALLGLRGRVTTPSQSAQVLYDAADPYTRKVIIDRGLLDGIVPSSPVLDEAGVLGQVTRVYPSVSEVTLVIDRDQAIPVLNTRTGARGVAFGDPALRSDGLELRFMAGNADVQPGDLLTTSGVDGVYPPGLAVARVERVERRMDSAFARISCVPVARVSGVGNVMVLQPVTTQIAARPTVEPASVPGKKGAKK